MTRTIPRTIPALLLVAALTIPIPTSHAARDATVLEFARQLNEAFVEVAETVSPSVVVIRVAQPHPPIGGFDRDNPLFESLPEEFRKELEKRFEERKKAPKPQGEPMFNGQGSGIIIRKNGYILTNRHVVENARKLEVRLRDGRVFTATLHGEDRQSDLAVLKIQADNLPAARFADSSKVRVGEFAIAIGAPFDLDYSVTFGHVSAKGRSQIIPDGEMDQDFIQTDANINPGNSGGPLVNINGEVMGINTLIRGLRTGIGFAVPSNLARELSDKLVADGKVVRAWLGIRMGSLREEPDLRKRFPKVRDGIFVSQIERGGPASKSELQPGDVIIAVESRPVITGQQLRNEIRGKQLGKPVALTVNRKGKEMKLSVVLEAWPESLLEFAKAQRGEKDRHFKDLGMTVEPLSDERARELKLETTTGIVITKVETDGPAQRSGFQAGDVVTGVRRTSIATIEEFGQAVEKANLTKGLRLNYISKGEKRTAVLKTE